MRPIRLDLNAPGAVSPLPGLVLLGVAVLVLLTAMGSLDSLRAQAEALDQEDASLAAAEAARRLVGEAQSRGRDDDPLVLSMLAQQAYAMEPARDLMERGWNPDLALLRADITSKDRSVDLDLETRSLRHLLDFIDWLERQPGTDEVQLARHQVRDDGIAVASMRIVWMSPYPLLRPGGADATRPAGAETLGMAQGREGQRR